MKSNFKCAHPACTCSVAKEDEYCSVYCEDAGKEEVEISCDCKHSGCGLTLASSGQPPLGKSIDRT
jgi:hypothetical protein